LHPLKPRLRQEGVSRASCISLIQHIGNTRLGVGDVAGVSCSMGSRLGVETAILLLRTQYTVDDEALSCQVSGNAGSGSGTCGIPPSAHWADITCKAEYTAHVPWRNDVRLSPRQVVASSDMRIFDWALTKCVHNLTDAFAHRHGGKGRILRRKGSVSARKRSVCSIKASFQINLFSHIKLQLTI